MQSAGQSESQVEPGFYVYEINDQWGSIMQVCKHFCAVAINTPDLWRFVSTHWKNITWTKTVLKRAKNVALVLEHGRLYSNDGSSQVPRNANIALDIISRAYVSSFVTDWGADVLNLLQLATPLLNTLWVISPSNAHNLPDIPHNVSNQLVELTLMNLTVKTLSPSSTPIFWPAMQRLSLDHISI
jgi:hypothetical protein